MAASAAQVQEYLVKLGVQMDYKSMDQFLSFLGSGKMKAAALSTALVAAGTAIYKFVKSTTEAELSLAQLAKRQGKSVEHLRAQQNALKAMNATAQEVAKDPALNKIYKDLLSINKEMALPDMGNVLGNVRKLQAEFYALRSTVQYGLQWINYYLLKQLAEPMQKIGEWIKQAREWLKLNVKQVASQVANYIGAFAKGLVGILEAAKRIFEWINRIPDSVRSIGTAILAVFTLIKSGPIGQIMMVVEAIGGLIQDYENFQWNKSQPTDKQVDIAFPSIWEALEADASDNEKAENIVGLVTGKIKDAAKGFGSALAGWIDANKGDFLVVANSIVNAVSEGIKAAGELAGALLEAITTVTNDASFQSSVRELFETLFKAVFSTIGGIGEALVNGITLALSGKSQAEWESEFPSDGENPFLGALGAALVANIFGADAKTSILTGIGTFIAENLTDQNIQGQIGEGSSAYSQLKAAGEKIWEGIKGGLNTAGTISNDILGTIVGGLTGISPEQWEAEIGSNNVWVTGLTGGIVAAVSGAGAKQSIGTGILTAIVSSFSSSNGAPGAALLKQWEDLKKVGSTIWKGITAGFNGLTEWWNGEDGVAFRADVEKIGGEIVDAIFGAKDSKSGKRAGGLLAEFTEVFNTIKEDIKESELFQNITELLRNAITSAFEGLWSYIQPWVTSLWVSILASMPPWLKGFLGVQDIVAFTPNKDGSTTMSSSNGNSISFTDAKNATEQTKQNILAQNSDLLIPDNQSQTGFTLSGWDRLQNDGRFIEGEWRGLPEFIQKQLEDGSAGSVSALDNALNIYRRASTSSESFDSGNSFLGMLTGTWNPLAEAGALHTALDELSDLILNGGKTKEDREWEEAQNGKWDGNPEEDSANGSRRGSKEDLEWLMQEFDTRYETADYLENDGSLNAAGKTLEAFVNSIQHLTEEQQREKAYDYRYGDASAAPDAETTIKPDVDTSEAEEKIEALGEGLTLEPEVNTEPMSEQLTSAVETVSEEMLPLEIVSGEEITTSTVSAVEKAAKETKGTIGAEIVNRGGISGAVSGAVSGGGSSVTVGVHGDYLRRTLREALRDGEPYTAKVKAAKMNAMGGRFSSQQDDMTVGEDGTEYIIPITKPGRAVQLLVQMFSEMGHSALNQVLAGLGLGNTSGDVSYAFSGVSDLLGRSGNSINYYNNVSAPISIVVQGGNANASETGAYVYSLAQRNLIRSVQGVLG